MSPRALPLGKYNVASIDKVNMVNLLTIVGCKNTSSSQKYERLAGLDLGKKYPELDINVVPDLKSNSLSLTSGSIAAGIDTKHRNENLCLFEIQL